ncbi:MAG TPA: metal-dependent hydrolase [Acidimicrobiales bacterium]|nr:metal-dependent hydrolase [Acidimicrobiales bacterium]
MTDTTVSTPTDPARAVPARAVPTRRMDLDASFADVPKHFAQDGDLILSHLAAALSAVFPDGEEFFVRSVRRFRDQVDEPALKRQVAGFIGQEAVHGREHRAFNDRLDQLGYPTKRVERVVKKGLAIRERVLSAHSNLAATAALEHFTATLAELVLSSEETRDLFGHPAVRDLFVWHALEESEHKAVAFDVYKTVGGSERTRVLTMRILRFAFVVGITVQIGLAMLGDRDTYRRGRVRESWRRVRRSPILRRELWDRLKDYDRADFHPDDHDTDALVEEWRNRLFGPEGTLNDKLSGAAA